jgi:large subunit ribosomal protein L16
MGKQKKKKLHKIKKKPQKKNLRKNKYKRIHKGTMPLMTSSQKTRNLAFGNYGIVLLKPTWLDEKDIAYCCRYIKKYCIKQSRIWIRIFPDLPITKKPTGIRMGKGKGKTHNWISKVSSGTTIIEIGIIPALNILKIENRLKKAWTLSAKLVNDIY